MHGQNEGSYNNATMNTSNGYSYGDMNREMLVEVRTIFNADISAAFNNFTIRRSLPALIVLAAIFLIIGIIAIIIDKSSQLGYVLALLAFSIIPLFIMIFKSSHKKTVKSLKLLSSETIDYYRFNNRTIFIETTKGSDYRGMCEFTYSQIHEVIETDSHFFIYISAAQAHIVPKRNIITGTAADLTTQFSHLPTYKRLKMK